jgi:hypothetical protein
VRRNAPEKWRYHELFPNWDLEKDWRLMELMELMLLNLRFMIARGELAIGGEWV